MTTVTRSLKVLLILIGVLSMAVILKLSVPAILEFIDSEVPVIWSSLQSWLTPPYLYVVINGIIITIAASSRFQQKLDKNQPDSMALEKIPGDVLSDFDVSSSGYKDEVVLKNPVDKLSEFEVLDPQAYGRLETMDSQVKTMLVASEDDEDDFVISKSSSTLIRRDSMEIPTEYSFLDEKPLVSARFGSRKIVKATPEAGKALGVSKPKRHETLESTWKTITDGRAIPLARHLKKSDTWDTHGRHHHNNDGTQEPSPLQKMKKADTFKDINNSQSSVTSSPGSGKLLKEPSPSQDELNRRVEAFIKKFNEDMRLQRQESLNQYKEMVNRGTY